VKRVSRLRGRGVVAGLAVMALVLGACGGGGDEPSGAAPAPVVPGEPEPEPAGGILVVGTASDPTGLDPTKVSINTNYMLTNMIETLSLRTPDGGNVPHLATSFTEAADGLSWVVTLRDDVFFHNGVQMTAVDVAYTYNLMASDAWQQYNLWNYWKGHDAEVVDDFTVKISLEKPNPLLFHDGPRLFVLPSEYHQEVGDEAFSLNPIGTGAYRFVEWRPDEVLIMAAFDEYWRGRPYYDEIHWRPIPDDAARSAALQAGEIDIANPLTIEQIPLIEASANAEVVLVDSLSRMRITIDTFSPPFDDVRVRQAINYAIDKQLIVDQLLGGYAEVIPAALTPLEPGYNPALDPYPYDPARARELLAEAGYPNGLKEKFGDIGFAVRRDYPNAEEISQAIAAMFDAVGISTSLMIMEAGDFTRGSEQKTLPPLQYNGHGGGSSFLGTQHYRNVISCTGGLQRWGGYHCNEEIDALIAEADRTWGADQAGATRLIQEAERLSHETAVYGFLYYDQFPYGISTRIDWAPHPDSTMVMWSARPR
jgi:peptide/nickel transport system substrate-binding protein